MTHEEQIKLQAYFDQELSPAEHQITSAWIASSPEALSVLAELEALRTQTNPATISTPDIEQAWHQLSQSLETQATTNNVVSFTLKVSTLAACAAIALVSWFSLTNSPPAATSTNDQDHFVQVETEIEGASSIIYQDEPSGWTIVWVEEPFI